MGKASMCIQMIQILNSGRIYKISELADLLETNTRNILEYKKELEDAGYFITSIPGRYGGYKLDNTKTLPSLPLLPDEKDSLLESYSYIVNRNDFPKKRKYMHAMSKIFSRINLNGQDYSDITFINRVKLAMPIEEINNRYLTFEKAVKEKLIVNIDFLSNNNEVRNRNVHPYKVYMYNGRWFLLCYCEFVREYRYFDFSRIVNYKLTDKHFEVDSLYNEHEFLDKYSMIPNSEYYHLKLKFSGIDAVYAKTYLYGKNQKVTDCEDKSVILEVDMDFKPKIISFILSFQGNCKIIEPEWLKEDIKNVVENILNKTI